MPSFRMRLYVSIGKFWNKAYRAFGRGLGVNKKKTRLSLPSISLYNMTQFLYQKRIYDLIRPLEGDIVECGVGFGKTFLFWSLMSYDESRQRHIWGFDSFEGFPEPSQQDKSPRQTEKGEWNVTSIETIFDLLVSSGLSAQWLTTNTTFIKGFFEESLEKYRGEKIALLHIDVDLYDSYKVVLETLYDRVVKGGVIAFDEYLETFDHQNFPGAQKAIDEFIKSRNINVVPCRDTASGKYYLIKP